MNRDIHLMCEVPATGKLYRAESSLSDADSYFFSNASPCSLLNVWINNREKI